MFWKNSSVRYGLLTCENQGLGRPKDVRVRYAVGAIEL